MTDRETLKELREWAAEQSKKASDAADERNMKEAKAAAVGEVDAYRSVVSWIDKELYDDGGDRA